MKILFFINALACGGKERRLTELLRALKQKHDCDFELAIMSNKIYYEEIYELKIPIHFLIRKTKNDLSVFNMFYQLCKSYEPDIVHCWDSMTAVYSVPVCKLLNIKLINGLITNSPDQRNIFNKHWLRAKITFPFSDLIIGNSAAGLVAYNAPPGKSHVINNGFNFDRTDKVIDSNAIRKELDITTRYIVAMVASNTIHKDYKTYLTAAQVIVGKRKDITFLAIGENTDSDELKNQIDPGYLEYFRLIGKRFGVESYIKAIDIGVLSTFTEGISNSILEYMALSKPVIATSGGGTNEIVVDQKTGFLVEKCNPQILADKIEMLINDQEFSIKLGRAGRERIDNLFTIEKMTSTYVNFYNKLITETDEKKINIVSKSIRESLAFLMIQLYYITGDKNEDILSIYFHNPPKKLFERILKWLIAKKYKFISVAELKSMISEKRKDSKCVFISFDDGWQGNIELMDLIEKFKIPVAIFVTTEALKEGNYWWEYSLINGQKKYSGLKKVEEFKNLQEKTFKEKLAILKHHYTLERSSITLEELQRLGRSEYVTIGSHTVTHPILIRCTPETQVSELNDSKKLLAQMLNKDVEFLAYPNGDYDAEIIKIAKQCGYSLGFTTNPGRIDVENVDTFIIPRNSLYDNGGYYENISKILGIWQKFIFSSKVNKPT
jgi:glycosyltransferase involved in cell wall biosynthesis/peptidoglycan/xylan/chitin deacetylase (PgdA/CDA1 family)